MESDEHSSFVEVEDEHLTSLCDVIDSLIDYCNKHPLNISPSLAEIGKRAEMIAYDEDQGWRVRGNKKEGA